MNERSIFLEALEIIAPNERAAFLDRACNGDADLRKGVEDLLAANALSGSFMNRPAVLDATADHRPSEGPGSRVGPYKLLQEIGEGGMGVVYMAEQEEPVRRKVALKIIKPGMDSKQVVARFEAERQALGMMDHPNIAKVFDAGTTHSGRPYFVMELVHGVPITEYCNANKLTPRERLELFVPVCQAIQHAHMKGIIHRDVKPSNVLVTMYDDKPVPKVIDFGVAKAVEQRLTEKTLFTQYGTLVGTFEYMSPEQAEMNAFGVDTRSDVYSLGVLLYELLTDTTPLERQRVRTAAFGEVVRLIKEEEPPKPSMRISSSGTLAKVAAARKTDPGKLSGLVRGELDWIVMRCLEKDRTRRYETAVSLARDVERHLNGDSVEACPPTLGYRLRKSYRKHRTAILAGAAFTSLILGGLVGATGLALRATNAERRAAADRDAALQAGREAADQRDAAQLAQDRLRQSLYVSDLQMAATMWEARDRGRTLEILERHSPQPGEPDIRGFEWHFLDRQNRSAAGSLSLPEGLKRITPDGRRVYVALAAGRRTDGKTGNSFRSWDLNTRKELPEWEPFPGENLSFLHIQAFSQTGDRALVACKVGQEDTRFQVFDLETRQVMFTLKQDPNSRVFRTVMDPAGTLLVGYEVTEISQSKASIWNVAEGNVVRVISVDDSKAEHFSVTGRAFHPNRKQFAAVVMDLGSGSGGFCQLRAWDLQSGTVVWQRPVEAHSEIITLAYNPDGKFMAEVSEESDVINLRNSEDGQIVRKFRLPGLGNRRMQKNLTFSPDGSKLAVSLQNQTGAHVFDLLTLSSMHEALPQRSIPTDTPDSRVGFTTDSRSVIVGSITASELSFYELSNPTVVISGPDAARSPYGSPYNIGSNRGPVIVSGLSANHGLAWAVWKVNGTGSPKAEVRAWDDTGRVVFQTQFDSLEDWYAGHMTRDGKRLILTQSSTHPTDPALDRSRIHVWDVATRAELSVGEIPGGRVSLWGIDPDGKILVLSSLLLPRPRKPGAEVRTRLSLWDLSSNRETHGAEIEGRVAGAVMSPDGSRVAWALSPDMGKLGKELRVWDAQTGQEKWSRVDLGKPSATNQFGTPTWSRDGRTLVVANAWGSQENQIHVLDAATGRDLRPSLFSPEGSLRDLRVSADGRRLFALTSAETNLMARPDSLVVWDLVTGRKLLILPAANATALTIDHEGRRIYLVKQFLMSQNLELETLDGTPITDSKRL